MYRYVKRFIDLIIAFFALLILSPLLIVVMVILLFTGEHEVFYRQKRIGFKNQPFYIWKFATMLKNSARIGTGEITVRNDPRVTKVGRILRITKINELPQLINVFAGDMSIVGPRPLMEVSHKLYPEEVSKKIYSSKPGVTGIGSLIFRDEEMILSESKDHRTTYRNIYEYKMELELWYFRHISFSTDMIIIFLTGWSILFPNNQLPNRIFTDLPQKNLSSLAAVR